MLVEAAGPLTTVQDGGRRGWMRFGVSPSGPVDAVAFGMALAAVGMPPGGDGVAIELSMGGITLRCVEGACGFAVTGPGFVAGLDGAVVGDWSAGTIRAGQRLVVRSGMGAWGYLALAGTPGVRRWLGRAATHAGIGLGAGLVQAGQALVVEGCRTVAPRTLAPPPTVAPIVRVRAVPGPQERFFAAADVARLWAEPWRATGRMDRMGRILEGPRLMPTRLDMPSEPMTFGNLQVDGEGRLTLLLADHQTTGGYPKIATLLRADAMRVAQLPAGAKFRLEAISAAEAVAAARAEAARVAGWLAAAADDEPLAARLLSRNLITARVEDEGGDGG